jgi:hypothetical protein
MYELRFYTLHSNRYAIVGRADTLKNAQAKRRLAGDLVFDSATGLIVKDKSWLWDWEYKRPSSYAHRAIDSNKQ